jgi:hypothetical protein
MVVVFHPRPLDQLPMPKLYHYFCLRSYVSGCEKTACYEDMILIVLIVSEGSWQLSDLCFFIPRYDARPAKQSWQRVMASRTVQWCSSWAEPMDCKGV